MSAFAIRPVAPSDYAQWLPLWEGYNAFYGRSGATALPHEITRTTWERFLDPLEPMHALVADDGARMLGLAHFLYHRSTNALAMSCYLQDLFTDDASRGRGVGSALIEAVQEKAKMAGAARLYWQTHESNAVARKLYDRIAERSGFLVYRMPV